MLDTLLAFWELEGKVIVIVMNTVIWLLSKKHREILVQIPRLFLLGKEPVSQKNICSSMHTIWEGFEYFNVRYFWNTPTNSVFDQAFQGAFITPILLYPNFEILYRENNFNTESNSAAVSF